MKIEEIQLQAEQEWAHFCDPNRRRILIGTGTCGRAAGAGAVRKTIHRWAEKERIDILICDVGCLGLCYAEPLVELSTPGAPRVLYGGITTENVTELLDSYYRQGDLRTDLALAVMEGPSSDKILPFNEHPMLVGQVRVALRNCGLIDPTNINHYIARGGYTGLTKALAMKPESVTEEVKRSGLRGRGGAGFPTARKWELCRASHSDQKFIICNADEGDPGAFMDRSVAESDPHTIIEGMAIAAYAIGAGDGYIYARAEYPLAIERLEKAIAQAEALGLLGDRILGTSFNLHVKLKKGAGAFVCGEETALMASIEGKRGMPSPRPPFPAQAGLYGKPTNINNVETLANVPVILDRGSEWFASNGTEKSAGTKTFSLTGKIQRTGLIEVPLGITLREVIFDIGGGIPQNKRIRAVQTGGPSGGCIPAKLLDLPVDYENLKEAGAIMGSGGMVVMDEDTCLVDIARYFVEFTQNESCGKCSPCRLGTKQMLLILNAITRGNGKPGDIELLEEVCAAVAAGSLCGLGQTAPNPVLTTLRYFREEYEAHIKHKKCAAVACHDLVGAPCRHTCPAGIDVPRYVRYIAERRYGDALSVIREKIPFPSVCGYICFHPCEKKCRRRDIDDPIAVRALKRFAAEKGAAEGLVHSPRAAETGKRVAVIGSGPGGLTAAYYLGRIGHTVTVFDRDAAPGGTLRTGIPSFRLPREVLDHEIAEIQTASGIEIKTGVSISSVANLLEDEFDAVLLSFGSQKGLPMGIEGEAGPQVFDCLSFLRDVNAGHSVELGKRIVVVGGGSSATDAARSALRLGATEVQILYRRTRAEMPAAEEEVIAAIEEGVKFQFLVTPVRIERREGRLVLDCNHMRLGEVDDSGRRRPVRVEDSNFEMETDAIIMAVGQDPEIVPGLEARADKRGHLAVDEDNLQTSVPGVFAAGDVVTGPSSVIEAIAAGRQSAQSIDRYLGGKGIIQETFAPPDEVPTGPLQPEQGERPRVQAGMRASSARIADGEDVEMTYLEEQAVAEAKRCLRCDLEGCSHMEPSEEADS